MASEAGDDVGTSQLHDRAGVDVDAAVNAIRPGDSSGSVREDSDERTVHVVTLPPRRSTWRLPLSAAREVCATLAGCLRPTLGPYGSDVAIVSLTNEVLLTNSGVSILEGLRTDNVMGRLLIDTALAFAVDNGDGSTRFTVLLHAALEHCESALGRARLARAQFVTPPLQRRMLGLARWFGRIQAEGGFLEETVIPRLRERSRAVCIDGSDGCWRTLQRVVRAAIGNQYSTAGDFLAQLVVGWVRESCPSLHQAKQHVAGPAGVTVPHAFALCLEATLDRLFGDFPINSVPGAPLRSSHVQGDSVLLRGARLQSELFMGTAVLSPCRFVVVQCSMKPQAPDAAMTPLVALTSGEEYRESLLFAARHVKQVVECFAAAGVNLILCTEAVSDVAADHARRFGIVVVQYVDEEHCATLCGRCSLAPLMDVQPATVRAATVGGAGSAEMVNLAGDNFLRLTTLSKQPVARQHNHKGRETSAGAATGAGAGAGAGGGQPVLDSRRSTARRPGFSYAAGLVGTHVRQLLVRGESRGICTQYSKTIHRCLTLLRRCVADREDGDDGHSPVIRLLPTGGHAELIVASAFGATATMHDPLQRAAWNVVHCAMLAVPIALSASSRDAYHHASEVSHSGSVVPGSVVAGDRVDTRRVAARLARVTATSAVAASRGGGDDPVAEPMCVCVNLVRTVLMVLQQMVRVDRMLTNCKRKPGATTRMVQTSQAFGGRIRADSVASSDDEMESDE